MNQEASSPQSRWLAEKELAGHLHISTRHLINLRNAGLPHILLGSVVRYDLAEVRALHDGYQHVNKGIPVRDHKGSIFLSKAVILLSLAKRSRDRITSRTWITMA